MQDGINLYQALSGVKGLDFELRRSIDDGMFAASVFCRSEDDIDSVVEVYGELLRRDTQFFIRRGRKKRLVGELSDVVRGCSLPCFPDTGKYDAPILLDEEADEEETELDITDLADVVDLADKSAKSRRFYESAVYEDVFAKRDELGLSIDYYKTRKGDSQFRYRLKPKEGVAGKWVSKDYVHDAVAGLKEYDILLAKGDWNSLRRAESIAEKYFTEEGKARAKGKISKMLEKQAVSLSCYAAGGLIDENTAKQVYSRLIMTRNVENVMDAVAIAKRYLPTDIADATERYLERLTEEEYERMGIRCLGSPDSEESTKLVHPNPVQDRQFLFLAA